MMPDTYFETIMRHQIAEGHYDHRNDPQDGALYFTIGELCGAIFGVDNDEDARRFFSGYAEWLSTVPDLGGDPFSVARANIGWVYGEGLAPERIEMWTRATGAAHPVFGAQIPTDPAEALALGQRVARAAGRRRFDNGDE